MVVMLAMACSTYEARDIYRPTGSEPLDYQSEALGLQIGFDPDTRFYSVGLAGVPVLPTVVDPGGSTTLNLAINLRMKTDFDFSFSPGPCLVTESERPLCPYEIEVSARAMSQDDGTMYADGLRRWHKIEKFYRSQSLRLTPSEARRRGRVSRDSVYGHYSYSGMPKWGFMLVDLTYKYQCESNCPQRFDLDVTGLVIVEELPMPRGRHSFEKTREADYVPLVDD